MCYGLGELDLDESLAEFRDRKLVLIVAPISEVEPATVTSEVGECPRCKLEIAERAREIVAAGEDQDVVDQVADCLDGDAEDGLGSTLCLIAALRQFASHADAAISLVTEPLPILGCARMK